MKPTKGFVDERGRAGGSGSACGVEGGGGGGGGGGKGGKGGKGVPMGVAGGGVVLEGLVVNSGGYDDLFQIDLAFDGVNKDLLAAPFDVAPCCFLRPVRRLPST